MTLFWLPRKSAVPPKSYDSSAQLRQQACLCFAPAVGVTQTKEAIMTKATNNRTPTPTHTPLPWRVFDAFGDFEIAIVAHRETAPVNENLVEFHSHPNARADAAFIVRACNNHYQLLALAKMARDTLHGQDYLQACAIVGEAEGAARED